MTKDLNLGTIEPIAGFSNQSFSGSIDGDFHTISYTLNLGDDGLRNVGLIGTLSGTIKNLNVKDSKIIRSPKEDDNKSQEDKYGIQKNSKEMKYNSVGLLVGNLNGGTVDNVSLTNSTIDLDYGKCYVSEGSDKIDSSNTTNVGGLIGLVTSGSVTSCKVNDNNIHVFSQKINNIFVGGVIGHTTDGSISGIATRNNTLSLESGKINCGCGNADNAFIHSVTFCYLGGFIGYVEKVSEIDGVLVNQKEIQFNSVLRQFTGSLCDFFVGGIYGKIQPLEKVKNNAVNTTSFKYSPGNQNGATNYKIGKFAGKADGIKNYNSKNLYTNGGDDPAHKKSATDDGDSSFDGLVHKTVSQNDFDNPQYKDKFNFSDYDISLDSYDSSLSYFDTNEAKKVFIKGESFSLGNVVLKLKKKSADEPETSNRFFVDSSAFKSDIPGTYTIKLSYGNIKGSYDVEVVEASLIKLDIKTKPNKMSYYVGDDFDSTGLVLLATYQDGTTKEIKPDNPNLTIEIGNANDGGKMINGENLVKFTYNDGTAKKTKELIVNASEKTIESISIENKPNRTDYHFGDEVKLEGLKIRVNYKQTDVASEVVEYSDKTKDSFGIYYPSFKKGENTIKVSYDDYFVTEFKVSVGYEDGTQEKLNEFVNIVNSISEQTSLEEKFNKIKEASALKDDLKNVFGEDEYVAADKKLQKEISDYNSLVNKINSDFTTSLESGTSLTIGNLTTKVFGIATFSITAILALLLFIF